MIAHLLGNRVRRTYLGGRKIDAFTGIVADCSDGIPRPEDWLASTTIAFNGTSEVQDEGLGRLADGRLVADAVGQLPFLVKLLDSDERLVIQAHPTVSFARTFLDSPVGKTECWYFLPGTASDACVYLGFKPGVTERMWRNAFARQEGMLDCLNRIPVKAGDFVFVDGGIPHSIGGGCFLVELQEPSDLMVVAERITPSGRAIPESKIHGGLGEDRMFSMYDYRPLADDALYGRYVKVGGRECHATNKATQILGMNLTDKFEMWRMDGESTLVLNRSPAVAVVTDGEGKINDVRVRKGDRIVVSEENMVACQGMCSVVLCR